MLQFIVKRVLLMLPTLLIISVISYIIIELPPGDYVSTVVGRLMEEGDVPQDVIDNLRQQYGFGRPWYYRYWKWITRFITGDFGYSLAWHQPVGPLIGRRLLLSITVSLSSLLFVWIVAFPIGIYSAVRQYSMGDYVFTALGFVGLSIPNFLLALVIMYFAYKYLDVSVGGLFSVEYQEAAWSWSKV